jgi:hypothetical protein
MTPRSAFRRARRAQRAERLQETIAVRAARWLAAQHVPGVPTTSEDGDRFATGGSDRDLVAILARHGYNPLSFPDGEELDLEEEIAALAAGALAADDDYGPLFPPPSPALVADLATAFRVTVA